MNSNRRQSISFFLSIGLHALIVLVLLFAPQFALKKPSKRSEVELIDPAILARAIENQKKMQDELNGQIVDQDEHAINDEKDKDAKFLSRHNQKVIQQTQAQAHGKFKNTDGSSGEKKPERKVGKVIEKVGKESDKDQLVEQKADPKEVEKKFLTSNDGLSPSRVKPKMKDLVPSFKLGPPPVESPSIAEGGGNGPSASDDHLKDVKTGMQTLLSTREFVYYSYYNRIKDKLRQYWEPKIKEKMERIVRQGRQIASSTDRITRIVIVLDDSGTLVRVQIVGPSGVNDLDDAAVEAFRAAAPFPNPPKGIVDPDGTIKIRWDFILEANNTNSLFDALRVAKAPIAND